MRAQLIVGWKLICLNCDVPNAENEPLSAPEADPLENLLIEHPSMSVYQMRRRLSGAEEEEEELGSDEDEENTSRLLSIYTSSSHTHLSLILGPKRITTDQLTSTQLSEGVCCHPFSKTSESPNSMCGINPVTSRCYQKSNDSNIYFRQKFIVILVQYYTVLYDRIIIL